MSSSLSEKSIYFSLTGSILLDALALPCDTLTINKTNGGQYPGDKMERKEIERAVQVVQKDGTRTTHVVSGMIEFAPIAGSTQGTWQWDGRYMPVIISPQEITEDESDNILEIAISEINGEEV